MIIDITMPLKHGMAHYPGDPDIIFEKVLDVHSGDPVNLQRLSFGSHSGTHVDAPYHLLPNGKRIGELPVDCFIGKAKVFAFDSDIRAAQLKGLDIEADDIVLFKTTKNRQLDEGYDPDHVSVLPCAAQRLADIGVRAVGIDCLSIESDPALETHRILLGSGIPIIEGLNLNEAEPGTYRMTGMVMRIEDSDGAPIRAMLETLE